MYKAQVLLVRTNKCFTLSLSPSLSVQLLITLPSRCCCCLHQMTDKKSLQFTHTPRHPSHSSRGICELRLWIFISSTQYFTTQYARLNVHSHIRHSTAVVFHMQCVCFFLFIFMRNLLRDLKTVVEQRWWCSKLSFFSAVRLSRGRQKNVKIAFYCTYLIHCIYNRDMCT